MPMVLIRYLLTEYIKVLALATLTFLAILITTRLEEIARFAAFGAPLGAILSFALYQIPYILPLVVPVGALVSAFILSERLSTTEELTALRASGLSLLTIFKPIIWLSAFLVLVNFMLASEVSSDTFLKSRQMQREVAFLNPLTLFHQRPMIKNRDLYIHTETNSLSKSQVEDVVFALWNQKLGRVSLFFAKEIQFQSSRLFGKKLTAIAALEAGSEKRSDNLYLENIQAAEMDVEGLSLYLKQQAAKVSVDQLKLPLLFAKRSLLLSEPESKEQQAALSSITSDVMRRVSLALGVFSLTLLGLAFGLTKSRETNLYSALIAVGFTCFYLICYFMGKGVEVQPLLASLFYFLPHAAILAASFYRMKRISEGLA